jgi:hypothetical protein
VYQLDLPGQRFLESSPELADRAAGPCPQDDVERLSVGPRQFLTDERFEHMEELAIPEQQAPFIVEGGCGARQRVRAASRQPRSPRRPWQ